MCVAATARRRRQQARNGFRHMPPKVRPRYKVRDAAASARRLREQIATENRIRQTARNKSS